MGRSGTDNAHLHLQLGIDGKDPLNLLDNPLLYVRHDVSKYLVSIEQPELNSVCYYDVSKKEDYLQAGKRCLGEHTGESNFGLSEG